MVAAVAALTLLGHPVNENEVKGLGDLSVNGEQTRKLSPVKLTGDVVFDVMNDVTVFGERQRFPLSNEPILG